MKKILLLVSIAVLTLTSFTSKISDAGDKLCKAYFPLEKGTELTYENYNHKDKLQGTDYYTVKDVIENADSTIIKVHLANKDKKGKGLTENDFDFICKNGIFYVSMESILDGEMMQAYKDMNVSVTQTSLRIPSNLSLGKELPDAKMTINISTGGMEIVEMIFTITDRKVEAIENITTAAGTFECYKLTQSTNMKMFFIDKTIKSTDWIVENIGSIRSETYNSDGNIESYRVLTNIKR